MCGDHFVSLGSCAGPREAAFRVTWTTFHQGKASYQRTWWIGGLIGQVRLEFMQETWSFWKSLSSWSLWKHWNMAQVLMKRFAQPVFLAGFETIRRGSLATRTQYTHIYIILYIKYFFRQLFLLLPGIGRISVPTVRHQCSGRVQGPSYQGVVDERSSCRDKRNQKDPKSTWQVLVWFPLGGPCWCWTVWAPLTEINHFVAAKGALHSLEVETNRSKSDIAHLKTWQSW